MTNDLSTLNGSLVEMKDQLIYELGQKGVSASYDSTTGLLGLIGKISEIQQGGSCYHIEFSEASYTAVGGSATLEIYLQENYAPKSGATVTLSDGTSVYSSITNSQGVATFNLTGLVSSGTWTCTYSNVSDTCTITIASYLFYDACDTDNTNLYDTTTNYSNSTLTFDSTNSCYTMQRTSGSGMSSLWIKDLTVTDQVKITVDMKLATTSTVISQGGPIIMNSAKNKGFLTMIEGYRVGDGEYSLGTTNSPNSHGTKIIASQTLGLDGRSSWFTFEVIIDGSSVELNIYNGSTLIKTGTITSSQLDSTGNIVGLLMSYGSGAKVSVKNIKVDPI